MSIYEKDLFGPSRHQVAIERIRHFCENRRVLVAFSGGKDSQCVYHLCEEAGIEFDAQYSITRFEPPELLGFIREHYPKVKFRRAYDQNLIADIEYNGLPKRYNGRWCCKAKHAKTEGYGITLIGVRWQESPRRRETWRMSGFKQDKSFYLCPIIDWSERDVWEYLGGGHPHCSLYDEGMKRIGCVMCPLCPGQMKGQSSRWPKIANVLRKGADAFVSRMRSQGFVTGHGNDVPDWCRAADPEEEYWQRWLHTGQTAKPIGCEDDGQEEPCLFAGTGFDEADGNGDRE